MINGSRNGCYSALIETSVNGNYTVGYGVDFNYLVNGGSSTPFTRPRSNTCGVMLGYGLPQPDVVIGGQEPLLVGYSGFGFVALAVAYVAFRMILR